MGTTGLQLQTKVEISLTNTSATGESEDIRVLTVDYEDTQNFISIQVARGLASDDYLVSAQERPVALQDITQDVWLKLLRTTHSANGRIESPKGYISSISQTVFIDEIRSRKRKYTERLPLDQNGELLQGKALITVSQGMGDPLTEYELKEFVTEVVDAVLKFPPKKMAAMLRFLWDEIGNMFPLKEMVQQHGIDVERIPAPRTLKEVQRFRSLVSLARMELRQKFNRPTGDERLASSRPGVPRSKP